MLMAALLAAPSTETETPVETHWYGWQTMATDAGAVALVAIGAPLTADGDKTGRVIAGGTLIAAGVGLYLAGGPLVHASHRRAKAAWMDAGFRLGLPGTGKEFACLAASRPF